MPAHWSDRTVVVTGCSSGIGAATVAILAGRGARVIGLDRRPPGGDLEFIEIDLADTASVVAAVRRLPARIDGLVNAAGVSSGLGDPLTVMRVNFLGLRELTDAVVDRMPLGSAVVNTSSLAAQEYRARRGLLDELVATADRAAAEAWLSDHVADLGGGYALSKEAVIVYSMRRAWEWAPSRGVRVNCTAPGVTDTPMLQVSVRSVGAEALDAIPKPLGRAATAAEQAHVLAFLVGPESSYVTGQVIWVDGGYTAGLELGLCGPSVVRR